MHRGVAHCFFLMKRWAFDSFDTIVVVVCVQNVYKSSSFKVSPASPTRWHVHQPAHSFRLVRYCSSHAVFRTISIVGKWALAFVIYIQQGVPELDITTTGEYQYDGAPSAAIHRHNSKL